MRDANNLRLDQGAINGKILAQQEKIDFRRVEGASRKIPTTLASPEGKRLYARFFNSFQLHLHTVTVVARARLPAATADAIEAALEQSLEHATKELDSALFGAEQLCQGNGITTLATYDTQSLTLEAHVLSRFGRRYLALICKVDQLMPMLETLEIDEVIDAKQVDLQKHRAKRLVRSIGGEARRQASILRRAMHGDDAEAAEPQATVWPDATVTPVDAGEDVAEPAPDDRSDVAGAPGVRAGRAPASEYLDDAEQQAGDR